MIKVLLANPRGFCAGVDRAIEIVERALEMHGAPIYVRHEVVHNRFVVEGLEQKGAVFVEDLHEVPEGSILIFSAHGVSNEVRREAAKRELKIFDATCPLVTKVHVEVAKMSREGKEIIMIGHQGHPEVEGTMGQIEKDKGLIYLVETTNDVASLQVKDENNLTYVTQTTLSMDDAARVVESLKQRFPGITGPKKNDICYATQNRQDAVKKMVNLCDLVIVVGSPNSSNSNRLCEVARNANVDAYMVDQAAQLEESWLRDKRCVGITAGASAPEILVRQVLERLEEIAVSQTDHGVVIEELDGVVESVTFPLPKTEPLNLDRFI
ncbi:4-hydroxy-3-methylbut-2-enyl diphosphate reductase [Nitrosomonas mobilis]|uniref:4-hydroxy-3-methylbut-2-enyl diphosphate reductase n=1 Tax=Nitrosomonas mobilis TaxID=51642 RepID=A0A1G5SH17_9PROT|nr:4-hydroxy-3-methylbut-2-enyl diphosphate reductase [Nitrosomonas mobilis]SCZ85841.1 1-hydroxy-2-methyl-2-(E)-butenyl 4-diphosphate reductase, 4Fe-4S protein [Nitrosomonas mobilis]